MDDLARKDTLDALARQFERFAEHTHGYSPLYERLSRSIAGDQDLLAMATHARPGQLPPNLLFGAVHYLLLEGTEHPLAQYYPSLRGGDADSTASERDPHPAFRAFCLEHRREVETLVRTRLVQTNEVGRCACLLPAFALVMRQAPGEPLALVEVGASAGLNLLWDRYGYSYDGALRWGDPGAAVQVACALRGPLQPPLPAEAPRVAWRLGLDLNPIDVRDADATLWLRALIWPEHRHRAAVLLRAIEEARRDPPHLVAGDALDHLPEALGDVAARRTLFHIAIEPHSHEDYSEVRLATYTGGERSEHVLGRCQSHGAWLEWLGQQ